MPVVPFCDYSYRAVAVRAFAKQLQKKGVHPRFAQVIARKQMKPRRGK